MGRQFENKKEAALTLKKFHSALESGSKSAILGNEPDYKYKYNLLHKRFRELEQVFDFHRGIIQTISSGIITINNKAEITFMNRSALKMFDCDYMSVQGTHIGVLFADKNEAEVVLAQVLNEQKMCESREVHFVSQKGNIFPAGLTTTLQQQPEQKGISGAILIFRNISNITNLRRQIQRMDRLATMGELSAGIAHEIRNPLAGIKSSAQVIEESFSPGDFRGQLAARIVKEIDRSNDLLKRFFNFARPSRARQDFHNIEMIIDGVYLLMAPRFKKKNIEFEKNFADALPQVYVDESQLEQVTLNLFLNAVDAMPEGGRLTVTTGIRPGFGELDSAPEEQMLFVEISDSGNGIPQTKLEKIFNPFYTTKSDGVGLGLSISSRLLEENNGSIAVQSDLGKGSTFTILLPAVTKINR